MSYIYKISNTVNNKVYIGKTLYSIDRRWQQHLNNANTREDLWHLPLYAAMRKHGIKNFSISQVEQVDDYTNLAEREKYWISYYDSYNNGYNATRGGDGSLLYDYEEIWELWESGLTIKQIAKKIQCNDFTVRTVLDLHNISTQERVDRSYDSQLNSHKPYQRIVEQLDPETKSVVATYNSVSEAANTMKCDSSNLSRSCRANGTRKTCGYYWRYKEGESYIKKDFSKKPVCQLDLNTGEVLNIYNSISEAARAVNGDSSYISKVCRKIQKSSKGYGWCYLEDNIT